MLWYIFKSGCLKILGFQRKYISLGEERDLMVRARALSVSFWGAERSRSEK